MIIIITIMIPMTPRHVRSMVVAVIVQSPVISVIGVRQATAVTRLDVELLEGCV
jgi:hypothetical protein